MRDLDEECRVFAQHLVGRGVSEYLLDAYRRAHEEGGPLFVEPSGFEVKVLNSARLGGWRLSVTDAYSRMFMRTGLLRRKLILVMALLENSADGADRFNMAESRKPIAGMAAVLGWGMRYAILLILGIVVFGPRHLIGGDR